MCAIAGFVSYNARFSRDTLRNLVTQMRDAMTYRGPDDAGVWVSDSGHCALAHRRLSVIDLSEGGRQPMSDPQGKIWVSFNGELYNYRSLRKYLESTGAQFRTQTDTEVLPLLFADMSTEHLSALDGMYSFGLWSESRRSLLLARDPFGKKPLYYSQGPDWFAFASELHALRYVPGFDASIDREAVSLYLLLQYIPDPHSIFTGARKLPPGHHLTLSLSNHGVPLVKIDRHAQFQLAEGTLPGSFFTGKKEVLRRALIESVEKRLIADVPVGAFLSGGVDSSLVTAIATQELGRDLMTFTVGFEGAADSEHIAAREIATHLSTDHYEQILPQSAVASIDSIAARLDEPNGDSSCLPTLALCQHARSKVTVALSGDGGDELFGGYGRYRDTINESGAWLRRFSRKLGLAKRWSAASAYLSPRWLIFQPDQVQRLLGGIPPYTEQLLDNWRRKLDDQNHPLVHRMRTLDIYTYLPGAVLAKVDRMSMQVALEVRCPLLDKNIARLSERLSSQDCFRAPDQTKWILKELASDYLPKEWMTRRKIGFGLPAASWSKDSILRRAKEVLLREDGPLAEILDAKERRAIFESQSQLGGFSIYQIWPLLILESWLRQNLSARESV